jgi:hypothetical protein
MENKSLFDFYDEGRWRNGEERYCHDDGLRLLENGNATVTVTGTVQYAKAQKN